MTAPVVDMLAKIYSCFPTAHISEDNELILEKGTCIYFTLDGCTTVLHIKCKLLEWFSKWCIKAEQGRVAVTRLKRLNAVLGTKFDQSDIELIYSRLGNKRDRELTVKFIESKYDTKLLNY